MPNECPKFCPAAQFCVASHESLLEAQEEARLEHSTEWARQQQYLATLALSDASIPVESAAIRLIREGAYGRLADPNAAVDISLERISVYAANLRTIPAQLAETTARVGNFAKRSRAVNAAIQHSADAMGLIEETEATCPGPSLNSEGRSLFRRWRNANRFKGASEKFRQEAYEKYLLGKGYGKCPQRMAQLAVKYMTEIQKTLLEYTKS